MCVCGRDAKCGGGSSYKFWLGGGGRGGGGGTTDGLEAHTNIPLRFGVLSQPYSHFFVPTVVPLRYSSI